MVYNITSHQPTCVTLSVNNVVAREVSVCTSIQYMNIILLLRIHGSYST